MNKEMELCGRKIIVTSDGRVLKPDGTEFTIQRYEAGYYYFGIHTNNTRKNFLIHRLVAKAFLMPDLDDFPNLVVHHIDFDRTNNDVSNLRIMDKIEHQQLHKTIYPKSKVCVVCGNVFIPNKTKRKRAKVCSSECKLAWDKITAAKYKKPIDQFTKDMQFVKTWDSATDIQNETGFNMSNINKCCNYHINSCYGFIWRYTLNETK